MVVLRYTLLRAFMFAVVAAMLWLAGFSGFVLVLAAILVSGVVSIFVLRRSRDQVSASLDRRLSTIKERARAEDAWDDARRNQPGGAKDTDGSAGP